MTFTFEWKLDSRSMNLNVYIITSFNPVYTFYIKIKIEFHFKSRNKLTRILFSKIVKKINNKPDISHITK